MYELYITCTYTCVHVHEYETHKETKESPKSTLNWTRPVTNPVAKKKRKRKRKNKNEISEFIEISGKAKNEQLIAEYINNLQDIPYYKLTFLHKSTQTIMGGYPIYSFTAYSYMPKKKKKK